MNQPGSAIPEESRLIYRRAGFGLRGGLGDRPAVVVVDATYAFVGHRGVPVLEGIAEWPLSCGEDAWTAVGQIRCLLEAARRAGLLIVYTVGTETPRSAGSIKFGMGEQVRAEPRWNEIVADIAPEPGDLVIAKPAPSAFFGTELAGLLADRDIDSLIVTGGTTSGCVRATAVDAYSLGLRTCVAAEAVFDRSIHSHDVALFELDQKYADVVPVGGLVDHLGQPTA